MMVNKALNKTVGSIRQKNLRRTRGRARAHYWRERDVLGGEVVDAGVIILPTRGCGWGRSSGCTMCGYVYESGNLGEKELIASFKRAFFDLGEVRYLKIFTSGSFFDEREVSRRLLDSIAALVNEYNVNLLQVESRPEFVEEDNLDWMRENLYSQLEVGIGLETSNDLLRENCINKGFRFADYEMAVKLCKSKDVQVKTYLLLKPPFIFEREAIADVIESAVDAAKAGTSKISINPMNVQRGTLVELLWKRGEYRPPWIWSLVEVLRKLRGSKLKIPVFSHPTGGGSRRGIHNCGRCDSTILQAIREFSTSQDPAILDPLDCRCKGHWRDYLFLE
jgi:radical SAM enzyme (TIGR01210 family)